MVIGGREYAHRVSLVLATLFLSATFAVVATEERSEKKGEEPENTTLVERVTVTATTSPTKVKDAPGNVTVVESKDIEDWGMIDARDLLRYAPGVYVQSDLTRLGASGFNIRGIGGNRVLMQVDGIQAAEQFDFGPFSVTQFAPDLDTVESVEIVRSAGSALYGSDALGGVVSFRTKDPADYFSRPDQAYAATIRGGFDSRASESSALGTLAFAGDRWQGLIQTTRRSGEERDNQGAVQTQDSTRTAPNPQQVDSQGVLTKWVYQPSYRSQIKLVADWLDSEAETEVFSGRTNVFGTLIQDFDATDTQDRLRLSVEQNYSTKNAFFDQLTWKAYSQSTEALQVTRESRLGASGETLRDGSLSFDQETLGLELQLKTLIEGGSRHQLTYGVTAKADSFDQSRDRVEVVVATGAPVFSPMPFPTKYFPESDVREIGVYVQDEIEFSGGAIRLIPGIRYDHYDLDADQQDAVFVSGNPGTPVPVDITESSLSPKLGVIGQVSESVSLFGQYARGFRAPPFSDVNNGFSNLAFMYRTLPNPNLQPETSDNVEFGVRGSFARGSWSLSVFDNSYDDFIETVVADVTPTGLIEFQPQNVEKVGVRGVELAGDAFLSDNWIVRYAASYSVGDDEVANEPLESIAPPRAVLGARYRPKSRRWFAELTATLVAEKSADDLPSSSSQFQAPSHEIVDVAFGVDVTNQLSLHGTLYNLTDEKYWNWSEVRGQSQGSSSIDRYSAPGFGAGFQLRYEF